jgi:hypothetical protein
MTHPGNIRTDRLETLEKLEETVFGLPGVDKSELEGRLRWAGSSVPGAPPIPNYTDPLGSTFYQALLMSAMAEALVAQQRRIEKLEKAAKK